MDAQYVKDTVGQAIIEGLTAVVRSNPEDAVDYLGRFLLHYADHLEGQQKSTLAAQESQQSLQAAAKVIAEKESFAKAAAENAPETKLAAGENAIQQMLAQLQEVDGKALDNFCAAVATLFGAAVHIAERTGTPSGGEEGAPGAKLKYIASTQEFVKHAVINEGEGITFKSWIMPEAPPAEEEPPAEDEEGAAEKAPPPPPELPTILVSNVLREPGMVFHGVPRPGAFVAAPVQYDSIVHDKAVPVEVPAEGADLPPPVGLQRSLAVCADTIGSGSQFSGAQVDVLKRCAGYLRSALQRTEQQLYAEEFKTFFAGGTEQDGAAATAAVEAATAEEESATAISALGEGTPEDVSALLKGQALIKATWPLVEEQLPLLASQVAARRFAPREAVLKLLTAVWYMVGFSKESLADPGQPDPTALSWPVARTQLGEEFVAKLKAYDPEAPVTVLSYQKSDLLKGLLSEVQPEEVGKVSPLLPALLAWAKASLDTKDAAVAKRKREAEEAAAAAQAKADAEAAAKAAAEGEAE